MQDLGYIFPADHQHNVMPFLCILCWISSKLVHDWDDDDGDDDSGTNCTEE